jgi:hypothetical protein
MRPRTRPMKFMDSIEKTSTKVLPSFLWAALLYSSQPPTSTRTPAILPQIRSILLGKPGTSSDVIALATKAPTRVNIPASIDSAKAAVGFFSTFTANVHPYNYAPNRKYQSTVTLTGEYHEPPILCRNIGQAKHWLERGIRFFFFFPQVSGGISVILGG